MQNWTVRIENQTTEQPPFYLSLKSSIHIVSIRHPLYFMLYHYHAHAMISNAQPAINLSTWGSHYLFLCKLHSRD